MKKLRITHYGTALTRYVPYRFKSAWGRKQRKAYRLWSRSYFHWDEVTP